MTVTAFIINESIIQILVTIGNESTVTVNVMCESRSVGVNIPASLSFNGSHRGSFLKG